MNANDYEQAAASVMLLAQMVQGMDLVNLINTAQRADAIMPIIDPTAYRNSTGDYRKVAELAAVLLPFQRRAAEVLAEIQQRKQPAVDA